MMTNFSEIVDHLTTPLKLIGFVLFLFFVVKQNKQGFILAILVILLGFGLTYLPFFFHTENSPPPPRTSDLEIQFSNLQQKYPVMEEAKQQYKGSDVFYESVDTNVTVSHSQQEEKSIRIERLGLESEPVKVQPEDLSQLSYTQDVLGSQPHGILEIDAYQFSIAPTAIMARFLGNESAIEVDSRNILQSKDKTTVVDLSGKSDAYYSIRAIIEAIEPGLYHIRFFVMYRIANSEKIKRTRWLWLYKK
jgi:hypothetical protein